jgi:Cu/Zn superoxide dismutase
MNPWFRFAGAVALAAFLVSCGSNPAGGRSQTAGMVAQLRSPSSSATGVVRVFEFRDGVQVQLAIVNLYPGSFRIAFHENANCRSPNLFSAGAPWAPPSWSGPPGNLLPGFLANQEGSENGYVAFVKGLYVDREPSLRGRSVVIHWGTSVDEAFPGQPNNRMACGVFEASQSIF